MIKNFKKNIFVILFFLILFIFVNFIGKMYIIPSDSMNNTLVKGDYFYGSKLSYGLKIPHFLFSDILMFPNINNNGYLYLYKKPTYSDIIIFHNSLLNELLIKRVVALEKDKIIFDKNNNIYIHFHNVKNIQNINKKNTLIYKNLIYFKNPFEANIIKKEVIFSKKPFTILKKYYSNSNLSKSKINKFFTFDKKSNYFIYTLKKGEFFVLGDNRNNSFDSRFIGPITINDIEAKAKFLIFSSRKNKNFSWIY